MKKIVINIILLFSVNLAFGQLKIDAGFFINKGDVVSLSAIENEGTIENGSATNLYSKADFINKIAGTLAGNGHVHSYMNWLNQGTFASTGRVYFKGGANQSLTSNSMVFLDLHIDKTGGEIQLLDAGEIQYSLNFDSNNKIALGDYDLNLQNSAQIIGASQNAFVITDGLGFLKKANIGASDFEFPVGASDTEYNPVLLFNNDTPDKFGVRVLPNALNMGASGSPFTNDAVAASWEVSKNNATAIDFDLKPHWYLIDELAGFDRTSCAVSWYDGAAWDNPSLSAAIGANPYFISRNNQGQIGFFAVMDGDATAPLPKNGYNTQLADSQINRFKFDTPNLFVFPNPTADFLNIETANFVPSRIQVLDSRGLLIFENKQVNSIEKLDVHAYTQGTYFIKIQDRNGEFLTKRFVKF